MILLLGLGISNKSIMNYLEKHNIEYIVYDDKLDLNINNINNINKYLNQIDLIIKSPGIPLDHHLINKIKEINNNVTITCELDLFSKLINNKNIIAVTGTNGKSTVVDLLEYLLDDSLAIGNIGKPIFDYLDNNIYNNYIIECSSYMGELAKEFYPNISCILNVYQNHLDHHKTFENYIRSKENIIKNTKELIVYNYDDLMSFYMINRIKKHIKKNKKNNQIKFLSFSKKDNLADIYIDNNIIYYHKNMIINTNILPKYLQNYIENFLAVICILGYLDYDFNNLNDKIIKYSQLEYRLNMVKTIEHKGKKIDIYNDSKSTNLYALKKAIESFNRKNLLVIMGGKISKNNNYFLINNYYNVNKILAFGENKNILKKHLDYEVICFDNLESLINKIDNYLDNIDIILFSPGSVSYDQYESFEKRGEDFNKLINKYFN